MHAALNPFGPILNDPSALTSGAGGNAREPQCICGAKHGATIGHMETRELWTESNSAITLGRVISGIARNTAVLLVRALRASGHTLRQGHRRLNGHQQRHTDTNVPIEDRIHICPLQHEAGC